MHDHKRGEGATCNRPLALGWNEWIFSDTTHQPIAITICFEIFFRLLIGSSWKKVLWIDSDRDWVQSRPHDKRDTRTFYSRIYKSCQLYVADADTYLHASLTEFNIMFWLSYLCSSEIVICLQRSQITDWRDFLEVLIWHTEEVTKFQVSNKFQDSPTLDMETFDSYYRQYIIQLSKLDSSLKGDTLVILQTFFCIGRVFVPWEHPIYILLT